MEIQGDQRFLGGGGFPEAALEFLGGAEVGYVVEGVLIKDHECAL